MVKKLKLIFLLLVICILQGNSQEISKYSQRLTDNWEFLKGDLGGIWESIRIAEKGGPASVPVWQKVALPHCYNAEDAVDPDVNYYQGPGWYRTSLKINNPYKNGRTVLLFQGAGQKSSLYIADQLTATHTGGYDEWHIDITDYINKVASNKFIKENYNGNIPISIRCDNSRDLEMIPSDLSDFNVYGGLYRYVDLIFLPAYYLENARITPTLNENYTKGMVSIDLAFNNYSTIEKGELLIQIVSPEKKAIISETFNIQEKLESISFNIDNPELWSPSKPDLYEVTYTFNSAEGTQIYSDHFGFRDFEFIKKGPFHLNGKRLLLKGTHRHEDHSGVGAAMTETQIKKEMQLIKGMGANFIRLGHYQQSRIVLNACDSLGLLVWEEIPWCRGGIGGETYKEQARRMLTNMIAQHYNHPSVIIWGLGNENDWSGDYPEFDKVKIREFMTELHQLSHQLDHSRKTAIRRCDFCKDIVDVYSPSIWAGWYRGKFTEYMKVSKENMEQVDHYLHVEWGASSHASKHSENPDKGIEEIVSGMGTDERAGDASLYGGQARVSKDGDWTETYACNLFDWTLKEQEKMPWLTGTAAWVFKDFSTPIRPENPIPYVNQKGIIERDFTLKESYYVFKSYWTEEPMIHIYGHSWPERWGKKDEKKLLKVYSNCSEVELIVNSKSMGLKTRNSEDYPAAGLRWATKFLPGENTIIAIGKKDGQTIRDSIRFYYETRTWGKPEKIELTIEKCSDNVAFVHVRAIDSENITCLNAKNFVRFNIAGDGNMVSHQGTSSASNKVQLMNGKAKIKVKNYTSHTVVSIVSENLPTAVIKFKK